MKKTCIVILILLTLLMTSCGPDEVVKSKTVYLTDLPAYNKYTEIRLDNYQFTNPDPFLFDSKETIDGVLEAIRDQLGDDVSITEFSSTYGIRGFLLRISENDHVFYQDLYDPNMTLFGMSDKYHGYELNGCDIYLYGADSENGDIEPGEILFPMVTLDSDYSYETNDGETTISEWREEVLHADTEYPLRKTVSGNDIDIALYYSFYDDLDCYHVEKVNDHKIKVTADKSVFDSYSDTENGMIEYIPSEFYYLSDFYINIDNNKLTFTLK